MISAVGEVCTRNSAHVECSRCVRGSVCVTGIKTSTTSKYYEHEVSRTRCIDDTICDEYPRRSAQPASPDVLQLVIYSQKAIDEDQS